MHHKIILDDQELSEYCEKLLEIDSNMEKKLDDKDKKKSISKGKKTLNKTRRKSQKKKDHH